MSRVARASLSAPVAAAGCSSPAAVQERFVLPFLRIRATLGTSKMRTLHDVDAVRLLRIESCAVDPSLQARRAPAVGDICTIVRVVTDHRVVLECIDADGASAWVAEIDLQDLEIVASHPRADVFRPVLLETIIKWTELIFGSVGSLVSAWLVYDLTEPELGKNAGAFIFAIAALLLVLSLASFLAGFCLRFSSPARWLGQIPLVIAIVFLANQRACAQNNQTVARLSSCALARSEHARKATHGRDGEVSSRTSVMTDCL